MPEEEFTLPPNENGEYAQLTDPPSPEEAVKVIASTIKSERQTMKDQVIQCEISTENSKFSRDSLRRAFSEGNLCSLSHYNINSTYDINSTLERSFSDKFVQTLPTSPNSEVDSETPLIMQKKTNRWLPRVRHALQQKGFIVFSVSAAILYTSLALAYFQDKAKFVAFFTNSQLYISIALISVLAIGGIFCAVKQFVNTEEHQTQEKNADKILDEVLGYQPKNKAIKSVRLEYSNGTRSNFTLNALEAKNGFVDIDKKVISRTDKIGSVINNRPLFTALLTCAVAANIALPIGLFTTSGIDGVKRFYQGCLTNKVGLSLLIGSCILLLSVICLGVHYYRKANCNNLTYLEEKIDTEGINKEFIEEIKQERTKVLEENHGKDAKRSSLMLEQVVVESHNYKDAIYSIGS